MVTRTDATYLALSWCQRLVIVGTELVLLSIRVHLFQPSQHTEIPNERVSKHISYNRLYLPSVLVPDGHNFTLALAVVLFVAVSDPLNPLLDVFVEHSSDSCDGPAGHGFGGSWIGGTTAVSRSEVVGRFYIPNTTPKDKE